MDVSIFGMIGPPTVCDGTQNVERYRYRVLFPVPNIFDTDTGTFSGTKFSDSGSETFFRYQIFPIPVPIPPEKMKIPGTGTFTVYRKGTDTHQKSYKFLNFGNKNKGFSSKTFSGTKFFRYHPKNEQFPVPGIPSTGTSHSDHDATFI